MTEPAPRKSDLGIRVASAVVMIAVAGTALWLGGISFTILAGVFAATALYEWQRIVRAMHLSGTVGMLWIVAGVVYIGFACASILLFRRIGIPHAILPILVTIATDTGAYFTGRSIGGPKIAPSISPSKTWSGLVGGMIAAGLVGAWWLGQFAQHGHWSLKVVAGGFVFGGILAVVAQIGDFLESGMKRRAGLKDSGAIIPGHGGVLDRVDGLLAVLCACGVGWLVLTMVIE